jgi:broad specificity phosphatase PhoE
MTSSIPLTGKGEIYFLRHGQTEGYARGLIKGHADTPLSAAGMAQAEQTGAWLAATGVTLVLSSPLQRALQTAGIAARHLGIAEAKSEPLLKELDTGIFTGITQAEASQKHPAEFAAFQAHSWDGVPGAETSAALYERAAGLWAELSRLTTGGATKILCVGHKGIFQWMLRFPFQCRSWMPLFEIDFCGIYRLTFDATAGANYAIWDIMNLTVWGKEDIHYG